MARRRKPIDLSELRRDDAQADGLGGEVFSAVEGHRRTEKPRRVESLRLSLILPDRFQPRPLLPSWVRERFFAGEIDCYEAARAWLESADQDEGIRERVDTLLHMGQTFESHGQIKPLTGTWQDFGGQHMFVIETGERRFWAACLAAVYEGYEQEPTLQVMAVAEPERERQVIENQHAEPPTAVGRAREIAALLLENAGVYPTPDFEDDYDYFRQALGRRHRMATWERLEGIMGVKRPYMSRLLKILRLPTPLLEMADHYQIPERVLREILDLPEEQQEEVLIRAIREGHTHEDIQRFRALGAGRDAKKKTTRRKKEPGEKAAKKLKSVFRAIDRDFKDEDAVSALASFLVAEMGDREALRRAVEILEDLANQIRVRVD